jgi:hypothetical protein
MNQKLSLIVILLFLVPLSTASILIQPPDTDKDISGLETGFDIGFVNTGSESVNLSLSSQKSTDIRIEHPQTVELPVSETTSTPEGSNWYYLGEGQYSKIKYIQIDTEIPLDTDTRRHKFDLSISRVYQTSEARPNVEQVQEFNFEIFSTSDRINTGFQSPENNIEEENPTQDNETSNTDDNEDSEQESSGKDVNETRSDVEEDPSDQGFDGVTILLILGIIVCAGWLFKEVL